MTQTVGDTLKSKFTREVRKMAISTSVETITPERAADLLAKNTMNRKLRRSVVERYARDMTRGQWKINGEPLLFNGDGTLFNGQHRLHACIAAGVPFETVIVSGLPADVMPTIDTGSSRSLGDYLGLQGAANASVVAAMVQWSMRYDTMVDKGTRQLVTKGVFTRADQIAFVERHEDLLAASAEIVIGANKLLLGPPAIFAFVHFVASRDAHVPKRKVDDFITYTCDPAGLESGEGPALLRAWLLTSQSKSVHRRPVPVVVAAHVAKAARIWLNGEQLKVLKWGRGSGHYKGESFPRIVGQPPVED